MIEQIHMNTVFINTKFRKSNKNSNNQITPNVKWKDAFDNIVLADLHVTKTG